MFIPILNGPNHFHLWATPFERDDSFTAFKIKVHAESCHLRLPDYNPAALIETCDLSEHLRQAEVLLKPHWFKTAVRNLQVLVKTGEV